MKWRYDKDLLCQADPKHLLRLEDWIQAAFSNPAASWEQLLRQLPGYYPLDVWRAYGKSNFRKHSLNKQASPVARNLFPEPFPDCPEHPLDYEWRFTQDSISHILRLLKVNTCSSHQPAIACLGCPSVAIAGETAMPDWRWSLFDKRARLLEPRVRSSLLINCDLTRELPSTFLADAAIVDPPWYIPITKHFLLRAQSLVKPGGIIFLSFPPEGTRPEAIKELVELLQWCQEGGLDEIQNERSSIFYKTPFFEYNSLFAAGFKARVPAWRKGDLLMFRNRLGIEKRLSFPEEVTRQTKTPWMDFTVDGIKFFLNLEDTEHSAKSHWLEPVWSEDILPTVSTKFPGRNKANFVTSGNRFFRCSDASLMADVLSTWTESRKHRQSALPQSFLEKVDCIETIVRKENTERSLYLKYMYD